LSLGWQSTDDGLLKVIGRNHHRQENREVLLAAREAGFTNVSVDLMFGIPGQTLAGLRETVGEIVAANPEHVSLYGLTYHAGTPFEAWRKSGRLMPVDDDSEAAMMGTIEALLEEAGYEHYEVSNYGRVGFRSEHNQSYWRGVPYLGVGPGAHSFVPGDWTSGKRWEAVRNPKQYAAVWKDPAGHGVPEMGDPGCEWVEELSAEQLALERLMVGLRTCDGVDLNEVCQGDLAIRAEVAAGEAERRGWARREGSLVLPTALGMQMGDSLVSLFFE
jgi:oxygen-independent coproporphyrinogen-3 oxidase